VAIRKMLILLKGGETEDFRFEKTGTHKQSNKQGVRTRAGVIRVKLVWGRLVRRPVRSESQRSHSFLGQGQHCKKGEGVRTGER